MLQGVTDDANQKKVAVEKLKALYGWADESVIEDVLVAVNSDSGKKHDHRDLHPPALVYLMTESLTLLTLKYVGI